MSIAAFALSTGAVGQGDDIVDRFIEVQASRTEYLTAAVLQAVGLAFMAVVLRYLYRVTKYRREELPRGVWPLATFAPVALGLVAIAAALHQLGVVERVVELPALPPEQAIERAEDEQGEGAALYIAIAGSIGALSLAAALILVAQHSRRAGLLTNFIGIIGIVVGAFFVIGPLIGSLLGPIPIVQWFWLGAMAALFLGYWPGGRPPAWESGEAEPWPSAEDVRAQRAAAKDDARVERDERGARTRRGRAAEAEEAEELDEEGDDELEPGSDAAAGAPAHPRSKKRKRKRRR